MRTFFLLLLLGVGSGSSQAALIFDTGTGTDSASRSAADAPGFAVGVSFSVATTVTTFAIQFHVPDGGNVKFMIWDTGTTNLYLGTAQTVGASATSSFFASNALNFTAAAGQTYYFGLIVDAPYILDYRFVNTTQNGLTTITPNYNYSNYANPTRDLNNSGGGAQGTLQIFGTQGTPTAGVPEPGTVLLLGTGLGLLLVKRYAKLL